MTEPMISTFQQRALRGIEEIATRCGLRADHFVDTCVVPIFSRQPQTIVQVDVGHITIWLFDDEASTKIPGGPRAGRGFERLDYDTQESLMADLLVYIQSQLRKNDRSNAISDE